MARAFGVRAGTALCAFMVLSFVGLPSYGAVTADPAQVTFTSQEQSAVVKLMKDGAPLSAGDIRGWRFLASGHDYRHMIVVEKQDGSVKIAPSKELEVGSYDLTFDTAAGPVVVQVLAPLSEMPDIIEKRAALNGVSEKKIEEKLGFAFSGVRERISIQLPPVYYEGQTLALKMDVTAGRSCAWFVNGDLIAEGPDQSSISYTFKKPGEYVLNYIETEKQNDKMVTVAQAQSNTTVVAMPAIPIEATVTVPTEFLPPPGYKKWVWTVDGQEVSTEQRLKYAFKAPAKYVVECVASSPEAGSAQGFLRTRYEVSVKPK